MARGRRRGRAPVARVAGLTVLQSFRSPGPQTNPYLVQLMQSTSGPVEVVCFSWRAALLGHYDIFHMHWPEVLLRGSSRGRTAGRRALFLVLLGRLAWRRVAVVRTVHNLSPHEAGARTESALQRLLNASTTLWVRLNDSTPTPPGAAVRTIAHGHYRDWFSSHPRPVPVPGRLLHFGLIRPYKGVELLLAAFAPGGDAGSSLRIVGRPSTDELAASIRAACEHDRRIGARLEYVGDAELAVELGEAELVVLPAREMHNSGSLLLALSLDRPALVPDTPINRALAAEVGPGWVHLFGGDLDDRTLWQAVHDSRAQQREAPRLSGRDWQLVGALHVAAYCKAVEMRTIG